MVVTDYVSTPITLRRVVMGRFIGVDLHKNMFTVSFYDDTTIINNTRSYKLRNIDLFRKELREDDEVAVEITGNTRFFV